MQTMTVCVKRNGLGHPRFGFAVGKRVGNSPVRSLVKRRLRELFRHLRPELKGVDVMVLARPPAADAAVVSLGAELRQSLTRLGVLT